MWFSCKSAQWTVSATMAASHNSCHFQLRDAGGCYRGIGQEDFLHIKVLLGWIPMRDNTGISDPRTWELAAPTIDASSSLCLPHSTNLWQSSEEEAMSWWGLWWEPPAPTFWDHWLEQSLTNSVIAWVWWISQTQKQSHY